MEYKALTQNTSVFTKTTTINTTTMLSDPLRYMYGTFRCVDSEGNKKTPYIFAPNSYQSFYSGSSPTIYGSSNSCTYDPSVYSCEVDGITYWGTKRASFYFPSYSTYYLKGIIKVIMYSSTEGTIVPNEYKVNLNYGSTSSYMYLMIPKLSEDIILSITFEEEATTTTSE